MVLIFLVNIALRYSFLYPYYVKLHAILISVLLRTYTHFVQAKKQKYSDQSRVLLPNGEEVICTQRGLRELPESSHKDHPSPVADACLSGPGFDVFFEEVKPLPVRRPYGQCRDLLANLPEFVAGWSQ